MKQKNIILITGLIVATMIVLLVIVRMYMLMKTGAGAFVATAFVTIMVVIGTIIFTFGLAAGGVTEWLVRSQQFVFSKPVKQGSLLDRFLYFWGRRISGTVEPVKKVSQELSALKVPEDFPTGTTMQDTEDWLAYINGRPSKGKKSKYLDAERFRAVRDWRIMQANGTSVTVQEFLEGRFGTWERGDKASQRVPHSTFYGWWPDFDEELAKFMDERMKKRKVHTDISPVKPEKR